MAAMLSVERLMHRQSIAVLGESAASYALLKLIPQTENASRRLRLNLVLVLDVSGSMYEEDGTGMTRLRRIQDAAIAALAKLQPDDRLGVVAFAHDAKVALAPTPIEDRTTIEAVLRTIDRFDVDPGGTALDQGLQLAQAEVARNRGPGWFSRIVVLTDGETSGETRCRTLAREAASQGVSLTVMGVGTEWNAALVKDLAVLGEGKWCYIDAHQPREAHRVFAEEFEQLISTEFTHVEIVLRPVKDVRIKRVRQVVPEIRDLPLAEPEERVVLATLASLPRDKATRYVVDLSLPRRPEGTYAVAQVEVRYCAGGGPQETVGPAALEIRYSPSGHGPINAEVAKHLDEVQIFEMNANLQRAIATENQPEVRRLAENIAKKGDLMGLRAARKTLLARQVLHELSMGGRVSRKTQVAVDDAARVANEPEVLKPY